MIERQRRSRAEISAATRAIYEDSLRGSNHLSGGNFSSIHTGDLERLFDLYDERCFDGGCREMLGDTPLSFRLSKRMTSAAGKATRLRHRDRRTKEVSTEYEIAVSTTLLFQTFEDDDRSIVMSGIECRNRLEALQRVLEHEMVHLIEFLIWQNSSCSAKRFQSVANRFFSHTEHTHQLITPRERALTKFGIKPGTRVSFRLDGEHYMGVVNRITKRATVLVEDRRGVRYTDGKRYTKFYVPVALLNPAEK
ncbi:MAG: SprT-like domain-containing protein [Planctomycetes bacterium]|nr:SprT-like domain-containing protein [Planctomycetota bacterium]